MATPAMGQPQTASMLNMGKPVVGNNTGAFNSVAGGGAVPSPITALPGTVNPIGANQLPGRGGPVAMGSMTGGVPGAPGVGTPSGVVAQNITSGIGSNGQTQQQLDQKQLTDIYGKGIGGLIGNQINNQSGVASTADNTVLGATTGAIASTGATLATDLSGSGFNSGIMQNYDASLAPTLAANQADLSTQFANSGVGANSSTAALGQADLLAQTQAQESGVAAQLTSTQLADTLALNQGDLGLLQNTASNANAGVNSLLQGTQQSAQQEVSSSGWNILGDVLNAAGKDGAQIVGGMAAGGTGLFG